MGHSLDLQKPEKPEDYLARVDERLGRIILQVGPCLLKSKKRSLYEALLQAIVYQQLNGTAAATILSRVKALYPRKRIPKPSEVLSTPAEKLRAAGLSRAKAAAIRDLAEKTEQGVMPSTREIPRLKDEALAERLTVIRGVGPWTVDMLLIFTLGRADVLPCTDYGVRKGFSKVYGWKDLPTPKELLREGEKWRPHRSTASWYLWRALELPL